MEKAEDRETKANARIDTLLTLIEMKPPQANISTFTEQQSDQDIATDPRSKKPNEGGLTTQEIKRIPVPEHIEPEPEKGASGAVFSSPMGDRTI